MIAGICDQDLHTEDVRFGYQKEEFELIEGGRGRMRRRTVCEKRDLEVAYIIACALDAGKEKRRAWGVVQPVMAFLFAMKPFMASIV